MAVFLIGVFAIAKESRSPNQDKAATCAAIQGKDFRVEFAKIDGNLERPALLVTKADSKPLRPWYIPELDGSSACKKLFYFPAQGIVVLDFFEGQSSGTDLVTKSRSLFVYRLNQTGMSFLAQLPLETTEQGERLVVDKLKTTASDPKRVGNRIEIEITDTTDPLNKKLSKHSF